MNKFVKLEGYEGWFLFLESELDVEQMLKLNTRMGQKLITDYLQGPNDGSIESNLSEMKAKFAMQGKAVINYNEMFWKCNCKPLLIREIGSWMLFHDQKITKTYLSEHFSWPIIEKSNIVICENDFEPEQQWVDYLSERFPEQSIMTLNNFSQRSMEDLKDNLEFPEFITFTTTFSKLQWFENLINTIQYQTGKTLIVHWKGDNHIWDVIRLEFQTQIESFERHNKIEIVKF